MENKKTRKGNQILSAELRALTGTESILVRWLDWANSFPLFRVKSQQKIIISSYNKKLQS